MDHELPLSIVGELMLTPKIPILGKSSKTYFIFSVDTLKEMSFVEPTCGLNFETLILPFQLLSAIRQLHF